MNNLKRFSICKLAGHKWAKIAYQPMEPGTGYFLKCLRCDKENHDVAAPGVRPAPF